MKDKNLNFLYKKDNKWFLESNDRCNVFTSRKSALKYASFYRMVVTEIFYHEK